MRFFVNGDCKELVANEKNGIEWTEDLLGNYGGLHFNEDGEYTMTAEEFEWWKPVVEMLNEINELEEQLSDETRAKYEAGDFDSYIDLDDEAKHRLEWLRDHV